MSHRHIVTGIIVDNFKTKIIIASIRFIFASLLIISSNFHSIIISASEFNNINDSNRSWPDLNLVLIIFYFENKCPHEF